MSKNNPRQPQQPQSDYNPFDAGIQKAMEVSRMTLGMNQEQRVEAFRNAINAFSNSLAQRGPVGPQKGLLNNLAALNIGTTPAMDAYNATNKNAMAENQVLAEKIMAARERQEAAAAKAQKYANDEEWKNRQLALQERTAAEQARHHGAMENTKALKYSQPTKEEIEEKKKQKEEEAVDRALAHAEKRIKEIHSLEKKDNTKEKSTRNLFQSKYVESLLPGADFRNATQSEIDAIGALVADEVANEYGMSTDVRYKGLPPISSVQNPAQREATLKAIMELIKEKRGRKHEYSQSNNTDRTPSVTVPAEDIGFVPDEQ